MSLTILSETNLTNVEEKEYDIKELHSLFNLNKVHVKRPNHENTLQIKNKITMNDLYGILMGQINTDRNGKLSHERIYVSEDCYDNHNQRNTCEPILCSICNQLLCLCKSFKIMINDVGLIWRKRQSNCWSSRYENLKELTVTFLGDNQLKTMIEEKVESLMELHDLHEEPMRPCYNTDHENGSLRICWQYVSKPYENGLVEIYEKKIMRAYFNEIIRHGILYPEIIIAHYHEVCNELDILDDNELLQIRKSVIGTQVIELDNYRRHGRDKYYKHTAVIDEWLKERDMIRVTKRNMYECLDKFMYKDLTNIVSDYIGTYEPFQAYHAKFQY